MAHILLTGATGHAGAGILAVALKSPAISHITILSRRPVDLAANNPKATTILHDDFSSYPANLLRKLEGVTSCIWAQGISAVGMAEDEYVKITHDYPLAAARAFLDLPNATAESDSSSDEVTKPFTFIYMSGEGATWTEKGQLYARIKGRAEKSLISLGQEHAQQRLSVYCIRPGVIAPSKSLGGNIAQRKANWTDVGLKIMGPVTELLWKNMAISTEMLARACLALATGNESKQTVQGEGVCEEGEGRVLRNVALRRLGLSGK